MDNQNSFLAVDFETANRNRCSICEIGLHHFVNGEIKGTVDKRINPEEVFEGLNIGIHGIRPQDVINEPTYPQIHERFVKAIGSTIIVSWTNFDKQCFEKVIRKYNLPATGIRWLDASIVARQVWPKYHNGYKLKNVARDLSIEYQFHKGSEDAKACGLVLQKALEESGTSIENWFDKFGETVNYKPRTEYTPKHSESNKEAGLNPSTIIIIAAVTILLCICCFVSTFQI